jgi:excisionase family DNA binding protein
MEKEITLDKLAYKISTAAKVLDVNKDTVYKLVNTRKIKYFTFFEGGDKYISRLELERYIKERMGE